MTEEQIYGRIGLVEHSFYKGKEYAIYTFCSHPCAYVLLNKKDPDFSKFYDDIDLSCHGGLTYSDFEYKDKIGWYSEGWVIGWDYAHIGDYRHWNKEKGYFSDLFRGEKNMIIKKHTVTSIRKDVKNVIDKLELKRNWKLMYK